MIKNTYQSPLLVLSFVIILIFFLSAGAKHLPSQAEAAGSGDQFVPDEVIIALDPSAPPLFSLTSARESKIAERIGEERYYVLKVAPGTVEEKIREFKEMPGVLFAEPN